MSVSGYICCFHGWAEASDLTTDRPSRGHLGVGLDNGCQGGSLFRHEEGRESGVGTSVGKGGCGGGKFARQKGKPGNIKKGPQP